MVFVLARQIILHETSKFSTPLKLNWLRSSFILRELFRRGNVLLSSHSIIIRGDLVLSFCFLVCAELRDQRVDYCHCFLQLFYWAFASCRKYVSPVDFVDFRDEGL